jgi:hypothetical protein
MRKTLAEPNRSSRSGLLKRSHISTAIPAFIMAVGPEGAVPGGWELGWKPLFLHGFEK